MSSLLISEKQFLCHLSDTNSRHTSSEQLKLYSPQWCLWCQSVISLDSEFFFLFYGFSTLESVIWWRLRAIEVMLNSYSQKPRCVGPAAMSIYGIADCFIAGDTSINNHSFCITYTYDILSHYILYHG